MYAGRILLIPVAVVALALTPISGAEKEYGPPLPGTKPLTMEGDIASQLVAGADKFLLREIDKSVERRAKHWKRDFSSAEAYNKSIEPNRKRLAHILGVRDPRAPFDAPELAATPSQPALVGKGENYEIFAVRWPAFGDVHGEGLLLVPKGKKVADVVAIPDADQIPEQIVGLVPGVPAESQFARRLAESGCRVIVPMLINRKMGEPKKPGAGDRGKGLSNREFLYRSAFELGRHLIGYEVQKVLAAVDWFAKEGGKKAKIGVIGYGEGGMLALYAGALDTRINAVCVSGYFGSRNNVWQEPIDRSVFGLLEEFGDAELASMITPRTMVMEMVKGPGLSLPGNGGGAPAQLAGPTKNVATNELSRADKLITSLDLGPYFWAADARDGDGPFAGARTINDLLINSIDPGHQRVLKAPPIHLIAPNGETPKHERKHLDPQPRHARQMHEIDRHNQMLLEKSADARRQFMKKLVDMTQAGGPAASVPLDKYEETAKEYRKFFYDEVIGRFDYKPLPFNARSRKSYDKEKWTGYEVVLDVFPDVIAYGILLLPKDLKEGEKRPVVVCQHGLEGRPQYVIEGDQPAYHDFAAKLAERGFITFAPQNLYIFTDRFRTLQRKANPLKKTLFSIITPQHQQIVDWLKTLPNVDPKRIGFYGLSYGGKTAMRVPALVTDYCLSICSADFGEWVWKNASTNTPFSYVWYGEYEIFEFDLGSTFNYAEMAALIAPRPFMVERGHFDGVQPDETVAYEFGKVRFVYAARLKLPDRCEIEFFDGPHTINGKGTFDFLHKHLNWPKR